MSDHTKALEMADYLDWAAGDYTEWDDNLGRETATELRRQHSEIEALKAERDALRDALESLLVYEPEHCACGDRHCTEPQEAWKKARAALKAREGKP